MAAGIVAYGVYVPYYRLDRREIGKAWLRGSARGEKAVANFDEDSVTMGVEAARNCLDGIESSEVDRFYFASTSPTYKEKQNAVLMSSALDLPRQTIAADFGGSLRCGTIALRAALDAVAGGSAKKVLVAAADCRLCLPQSEGEQNFGDSAASLLVGNEHVAVAIEGYYSHSDEIVDVWRNEGDTFVRNWEDRYAVSQGYMKNMSEAVSLALKKYGLVPNDFSKVILYAPDPGSFNNAIRTLKFDPAIVQDPLFTAMGNSGSAFVLTMLCAALDQAKPGDKLLMVNYSNGCDVYILRVTEEIERIRNIRRISHYLGIKKMLPSYEKYLQFRDITPTQAPARPPDVAYSPAVWRDRDQILGLKALKCRQCGTMQFPRHRICYTCKSFDNFDLVRLSDKKGTVFTYVIDYLVPNPNPPTVVAVVDIEGCRMYMEIVECDAEAIKLDMLVEPVFRKIHEAGGFTSYSWKCRAIKEA